MAQSQESIKNQPKAWETKAPKDLTEDERKEFFESIWGQPNDRGLMSASLVDIKSVFSPQEMKDKYQEVINLVQEGKAVDKSGKPSSTAKFEHGGYLYGISKWQDNTYHPWRVKQNAGGGSGFKSSGPKYWPATSGVMIGDVATVNKHLEDHPDETWDVYQANESGVTGQVMFVMKRIRFVPITNVESPPTTANNTEQKDQQK